MSVGDRQRFSEQSAVITAVVVLVLVLLANALWRSEHSPSSGPGIEQNLARHNSIPVHISPRRIPLLEISSHDLMQIRAKIVPPPVAASASYYLHVLRFHGPEATFANPELPSSSDIIGMLTDADWANRYLGASVAVRSRNGIALIGGNESQRSHLLTAEAHRDQMLGAFGEFGIPLSHSIAVDGASYSLQDVLDDTIANFHYGQRESQWSGLALAFYHAPQREWTNKFGETFSFDGLVDTLIDAPLAQSTCAGTHLLHTLTIIYRVDTEHAPILSPEKRERARNRLEECIHAAVTSQAADGSWLPTWCQELIPVEDLPYVAGRTDSDMLIATGHIGEWLLYVPEEFQVPETTLKSAGYWLTTRLLGMTQNDVDAAICPVTHAACVVQALAAEKSDSVNARSSTPN